MSTKVFPLQCSWRGAFGGGGFHAAFRFASSSSDTSIKSCSFVASTVIISPQVHWPMQACPASGKWTCWRCISLSIHLSVCRSNCLSTYLSICRPIYVSLSVCLSIYQPVYTSTYLSTQLTNHLSIHPSVKLSIHPPISLSVCLSMSLTIQLSIFHLSFNFTIYVLLCLSSLFIRLLQSTVCPSQPFLCSLIL